MDTLRNLSVFALGMACCASASPQTAPPRDPTAVAILQSSVAAMGASVPADSVATGTVQIVAGSKTDSGTIRILTRGVEQTGEHFQTTNGSQASVYSRGQASEINGTTLQPLQLELVLSSQCPDFPLPVLAGALGNPDTAFQYIGLETIDGVSVQHIRFWNTFASNLKLQHLADFSVHDLRVGVASGLPRKLSYNLRAAGGSEPRVPVEVFFSDYRSVGGVLYPFLIQKSLNGTPWATITIQSVAFNVGLTDSDFPVQ